MNGIDTDLICESIKELDKVGPGGSFTHRDLTLDLWRKEIWYPRLMRRIPQKTWITDKPGPLKSVLKKEVDRIVSEEGPALLPASASDQIDGLLKSL
jgi:hypothetical protein